MEKSFVGIDVSKEKLDVALLNSKGIQHKIVSNRLACFSDLLSWLEAKGEKLETLHIVMEATGNYHLELACYLVNQAIKTSVENPSKINAFAKVHLRRGKDDKQDAKLIAHYAKVCQPAIWHKPRQETLDLQSLLAEYDSLKDQRVIQLNRLKSLTSLSHVKVKQSIESHCHYLDAAIKTIEENIREVVHSSPETLEKPVALAQSVPGIGFMSAVRLVTATEAGSRFKRARQLAAYLGLTPCVKHSGKNQFTPARLSKIGQANLRAKLYFPAIQATLHNPDIKAFYQRLLAKGKRKMVALAAAMRKLVHIVFGVLKNKKSYVQQNLSLATI